MYYEEQWINRRQYFKTTPNGEWKEFSIEMYASRLKEKEDEVLSLKETIDELISQKNCSYFPYV